MNAQHRSNLAKVALAVLRASLPIEFDMEVFAARHDANTSREGDYAHFLDPHECGPTPECGTACCLAGHGIYVLPCIDADTWKKSVEALGSHHGEWSYYIHAVFGINFSDASRTFLFAPRWPSNRGDTARRVLFFLEQPEDLIEKIMAEYGTRIRDAFDAHIRYPDLITLDEENFQRSRYQAPVCALRFYVNLSDDVVEQRLSAFVLPS